MVAIRKKFAGSALGYVWPEPGVIVDVAPADAAVIIGIKDAHFTEVPAAELQAQIDAHAAAAADAKAAEAAAKKTAAAK